MNNKLSLCHNPSLSIILIENLSISAITKRMKKKIDRIKHPVLILPKAALFFLNESIETNNGTRRKDMNPIAEPALWILDEVVTSSFDLLTLKKLVRIQDPIANIAMKTIEVQARLEEVILKETYKSGNATRNKRPSKNIQTLKGIRTGLSGFPRALIDIFMMLYSV